jgi:tetratricopeptide (TPR) repeat protein
MKINVRIFSFLLILALSSSFNEIFSQEQSKTSRQSAMEAFSNGNFEQAYKEFSELLQVYPKDPLYKYYSSICLINMGKDPVKAQALIEQALKSVSIKPLPDDAVFYLGRTQQMTGQYPEALKSFNRFTAQAGKKKAKDLKVPEYIQQCKDKTGKIAEAVTEEIIPENSAVAMANEKPDTAKKKLSPELNKNLDDALDQQFKKDSLAAASSGTKKQEPFAEKNEPVKNSDSLIKTNSAQKLPDETTVPQVKTYAPVYKPVQENKVSVKPEPVTRMQAGAFSVFEILKSVPDPKGKIDINPVLPEGLNYRIQMGVFKNPVALSFFKGFGPVYGTKAPGAAVTSYYVGMFRKSSDAVKALSSVKAKGFKTSFIVAFLGSKPVSSDRAAVLEKEWGSRPLFNIVEPRTSIEADTIPPTLIFRVEVARSRIPLKADAVNNLIKLAGDRGLDIVQADSGNIAYLIGSFITFESADNYAGILNRNGYHDSRVVAWLGKKEINIDTAKQLFEGLK